MPISPLKCRRCHKWFADYGARNAHVWSAHRRPSGSFDPIIPSESDTTEDDATMPTNPKEQIKKLEREVEQLTWEIDRHYRDIQRAERLIAADKTRQEVLSSQLFQLKGENNGSARS